MKNLIALVFLLLLQSCASVSDLRSEQAKIEFNSQKSADEILECITESWSKHNNPSTTSKIKDGWSMSLINTSFSSIYAVVDIRKIESGSNVKYHEQSMYGMKWPSAGVDSCR